MPLEKLQRCRPMALIATLKGGEEQENPRNQGKLWCVTDISTLNRIRSHETHCTSRDHLSKNNGALVLTVFYHSWFTNGISFHSNVCEAVIHWACVKSVEKPGVKLMLYSRLRKKMAKSLRSWMQHCRFLHHLLFLLFWTLNLHGQRLRKMWFRNWRTKWIPSIFELIGRLLWDKKFGDESGYAWSFIYYLSHLTLYSFAHHSLAEKNLDELLANCYLNPLSKMMLQIRLI